MALSETWFMEQYIDFELQRYRLLAYLKEVKSCFSATKLYPQLTDIIFHYNNLISFRDNKRFLQEQFPRKLDAINMKKLELVYEDMLADDGIMQELEQIIQYAIAELKGTITEGAGIYECIERKMEIEPVGIIPLYKNEGYIFLRYGFYSEVRIYNYTITLFEHQKSKYRGIRMHYVDSRTKSLVNTYEQIKIDLIRAYRMLPNPAVYKVEFPLQVPLDETLLPIAKRELVKYIDVA